MTKMKSEINIATVIRVAANHIWAGATPKFDLGWIDGWRPGTLIGNNF